MRHELCIFELATFTIIRRIVHRPIRMVELSFDALRVAVIFFSNYYSDFIARTGICHMTKFSSDIAQRLTGLGVE